MKLRLHVSDERISTVDIPETREADLRDDGAELAARGRDTVRGRPVARRERLPGDDERRRVRPKVLEEVREAVEEDERVALARRVRLRDKECLDELGCIGDEMLELAVNRIYGKDGVLADVGVSVLETGPAGRDERFE